MQRFDGAGAPEGGMPGNQDHNDATVVNLVRVKGECNVVTLQEIGDSLGVSKSTVSLVLSGKDNGRVSAGLASKVRDRAENLGYMANPLASSLRTKRTRILGFISNEIATTPYAGRLILGAQDAARQMGYILLTVDTDGSAEAQASETRALSQYGVDGFLYAFMYNQVSRVPQDLKTLPTVMVDATDARGMTPSIVPNERHIGRLGTHRLVEAGCRRIAFIGSYGPMQAQNGRLRGYCDELASSGIGFDPNLVVNVEMGRDGIDKVDRLFERERPDGCFCFNDARSWYVYMAASKRNLAIGRDISVVGVDNHQVLAEMLSPALTTIELPHYEMGYWGVLKLVSMIEKHKPDRIPMPNTKAPLPTLDRIHAQVECALIEKESVAQHV